MVIAFDFCNQDHFSRIHKSGHTVYQGNIINKEEPAKTYEATAGSFLIYSEPFTSKSPDIDGLQWPGS